MRRLYLTTVCVLAGCNTPANTDVDDSVLLGQGDAVDYLVEYESAATGPLPHHLYLVESNCELAFLPGTRQSRTIVTEHYQDAGDVFVQDRGRDLWFYRVPTDRAQPVEVFSSPKRNALRLADGSWRPGANLAAELTRPANKILNLRAQCGAPFR